MKFEEAYEGQRVRVCSNMYEHFYGKEGVIIQKWTEGYKWHDYATVETDDDCFHIEYEYLEAIPEEPEQGQD